MAENSQSISFHVPAGIARQLDEAGLKESPSLSGHEYARKILLAALAAPSPQELLSEIQDTKRLIMAAVLAKGQTPSNNRGEYAPDFKRLLKELLNLRFATASGVAAILAQAGGVQPKEAEAWVRQNILTDGS